jgi:uncharacterized membrane protein YGL010W
LTGPSWREILRAETMLPRKTADEWFAAYGIDHQNAANKAIQWICAPVSFLAVFGFAWAIPVPEAWSEVAPWFNWGLVAIALATAFYIRLSPALAAGLLFFMALGYTGLTILELHAPWPVWKISCVVFGLSWAVSFVGHLIEHRYPSLAKDLWFILIGPAWVLSALYRRLGQRY